MTQPYFDIGNTKNRRTSAIISSRLPSQRYREKEEFLCEHGSRVRGQLLTKRLMLSDPRSEAGAARSACISTAYLFPLPTPISSLFSSFFLSIWPACFALRYVYEEALDVSTSPGRAVSCSPSRKTPAWKTDEKLSEYLPRRRKKNVSLIPATASFVEAVSDTV